ncbi:hypothetical protein BVC80_883g22 [Macleaya cordata]|uniref:DUF7963 domain-containing protein n=1 Tax=Macleaya cordata TaxID=56857 RepID=A0A200RD64_MACCD|nr:hypothetical protein BVC80_883g22 [Macleaya cordata]
MAAICHAQEDDMFSRNLQKRYNGLIMVRTRAIRGKGAWYWSHLEPILFQNQDTGTAKSLKLRCGLCNALFSASNPSRTASEHLKQGTCPNFRNGIMPKFRKHNQLLPSLAMIPAPCSIKPIIPSPPIRPQLTQSEIDTAFDLLTEWFYESCGYVSLTTLDHPKFKSFLSHIGLPSVHKNYILGRRLDAKYVEAKFEFEDKLRDAMFFQLSTNGWTNEEQRSSAQMDAVVNVTLNLPNGSSLFHRVLFLGASRPSLVDIREVLSSMVGEVSGGDVLRCAGVVADVGDINNEALRELEFRHHWMVNITCQSKALHKLLKDFFKRLPLFASTASLCHKLVQIFKPHQLNDIIICLNHHQTLSHDQTSAAISSVENVIRFSCTMSEAAKVLADKAISSDPLDQEFYDAIRDPKFWRELECVLSLIKLIKTLLEEIEEERPSLGQCLPLWEEVRSRIKGWCNSFSIEEKPVMELVNRRFSKNYHQAWAASYILDPLYLVENNCGRYLPPFKFLSSEQEKDVVKIITRLTQNEEAHIALMELMKWRTEGLDPVYARAVQAKERDPVTGKMKVVNPRGSRLIWETYLNEFQVLRKVAARLIFLQATTGRLKMNQPYFNLLCSNSKSNNAAERAQKVLFVSSNGRLGRKEFTDEEEKLSEFGCKSDETY